MLSRFRLSLLILLFVIFCRERINEFDPGSEDFVPPPPIFLAWPLVGWYNYSGYLVGFTIQVDFVEPMPRTMSIKNTLCHGQDVLDSVDKSLLRGTDSYQVDLISGSALSAGIYTILIYWGEISIGSCPINVIEIDNQLIIDGVAVYDTLDFGD